MNSLYGRFGINPNGTVTEICDKGRYMELIDRGGFAHGEPLGNGRYLCAYFVNTLSMDDFGLPRNAAVQVAAAITAYARMHMYPLKR